MPSLCNGVVALSYLNVNVVKASLSSLQRRRVIVMRLSRNGQMIVRNLVLALAQHDLLSMPQEKLRESVNASAKLGGWSR